ncbi:MAG TPA: hypothetical protein VL728_16325 [Cyclobacteriaceae bacterium]|jgi:hypothetical protein|nr:hypothetical protein [Cyclobacteriaceae bacterium]
METKKNSSESSTPQLPSFDSNIAAIYFLANSARGLMKMLRDNLFVSQTLSSYPTNVLVEEFNKRITTPIQSSEGIANVYAILVALTFKDKSEVKGLFQKVSQNIKFEWFSDIANIYLNDLSSFPTYKIIEGNSSSQLKQADTSNDSVVFYYGS